MELKFENITIANLTARYCKVGEGEPATFYGANGFPIGTYSKLLDGLKDRYAVHCLSQRPCWPQPGKRPKQTNWEVYAKDLIEFLDQLQLGPVTAIGHSQGATATIIAASWRPDLFKKILVVEPASVSPAVSKLVRVVPMWFKRNFEPWKTATKKQDRWDDPETFFNHLRRHRAFRRVSDEVLQDYVKYGLTKAPSGNYQLTFPRDWEVINYALPPYIINYVKNLQTPVTVLAGKPSVFLNEKVLTEWKRVSPSTNIIVKPEYGHLLPLEAPELVGRELKLVNGEL